MSDRQRRPGAGRQPGRRSQGRTPHATQGGQPAGPKPSSPAAGAGSRRGPEARRPPGPGAPTLADQVRKPFVVSFIVFVITAAGLMVATQQCAAPSASPAVSISSAPGTSSR